MSLDITLIDKEIVVYDSNITHNLGKMADAAGLYKPVWRPEENGIIKADDLIPFLRDGINSFRGNPDYYRQFDAENGWGTYDDFLPWLESYLLACVLNPDSRIEVSR